MCGTTELFSDVLINLCHIMDFGSGQQLILINVECMFSVGMSVLLVSPLSSFSLCWSSAMLWLSAKSGIKVMMPFLVKCLLFMAVLPTPLSHQLDQNHPTRVLIFLSVNSELLCFCTQRNWEHWGAPGLGPHTVCYPAASAAIRTFLALQQILKVA